MMKIISLRQSAEYLEPAIAYFQSKWATEESYRGRNLGKQLIEKAMQEAGSYGFKYLNLCTDHIGYYEKFGFQYIGNCRMGFEVTREFDCFRQTIKQIDIRRVNTDCIIEQVGTDSIRQAQNCCDFNPSWQNSIGSIERGASGLICLGAFLNRTMVGHCVFDVHTGDLAQIAVQSEYRRKGIASRLLKEAIVHIETDFIKILNISSDSLSMPAFLKNKNIPLASRQFEMMLPL